MSKGKTWQRVASAFLAAVMTFSTFSTTIAYAAEATTDSSITTDAVSDTDAAEEVDATNTAASSSTTEGEVTKPEATEAPAATETPDETDATEPEETPAPTEAPTPTPEPTESPEATAEPEPTEEPEETETPNVSESDFVAVGLADDATEGQIDAEIGDEITFNAHVNRDDVNLQYQWYKRFIEPQTAEYDEDLMEYDYGSDEPTAYGFLVEGKTPAEVLAENPDAGWSGIELYRAVVSAMEAIGVDTSNVNIEFGTRNYALEGFTITATMVDSPSARLPQAVMWLSTTPTRSKSLTCPRTSLKTSLPSSYRVRTPKTPTIRAMARTPKSLLTPTPRFRRTRLMWKFRTVPKLIPIFPNCP